MFLKEIKLVNFKNHTKSQFSFTEKVVCFVGLNGIGKTNVLDAIHFSCIGKSYFSSADKNCINQNDTFFRLEANIEKSDKTHKIVATLQKGRRKKIEVNDIPYGKITEHVGRFPLVIVAPDDNVLILGSSEERRKLLDRTLAQAFPNYLQFLTKYNKILAQRNALLKDTAHKEIDFSLLEIYDSQLVPLGKAIFEQREQFVAEIIPFFNQCYQRIAGKNEALSLVYKSQLIDDDFATLLKKSLAKDKILQRSTCGVHKDDVVFMMGEERIKTFGSQGQQKTFLLALKLSIFAYLKEKLELEPLFLIDDMFDKLDENRGLHLVKYVHNNLGQVFITHTHEQSFVKKMGGLSFQLIAI
ncbi:MAG: DNA replication/repair protein RecF [Chitinophagales bacterium]